MVVYDPETIDVNCKYITVRTNRYTASQQARPKLPRC